MKCCLCGGEIKPVGDWTEGNNAEPAAEGRCCDECNSMIVIPMRLALGRLTTARDGRGFRTDKPLSDDEWQRLINLVAAAPELLESLKRCVQWLSDLDNDICEKAELLNAMDAIAKAEGRAE